MTPAILLSKPNIERLQSTSNQVPLNQGVQDVLQILKECSNPSESQRLDASIRVFAILTQVSSDEGGHTELNALATLLSSYLHDEYNDPKMQETQSLIGEIHLATLLVLCTSHTLRLDGSTLRSVAAYTDAQDPWTTVEAANIAQEILSSQLNEGCLKSFIISHILQDYLRPIFTNLNTRVAPTERPALSTYWAGDARHKGLDQSSWKKQGGHIISIFGWSVKMSNPELMKNHWPLFTPVVLTIMEDQEVHIRNRGLDILISFLDRCPTSVIKNVGLDRVFQDAIFPSLLHLPNLTPEVESVALLQSAYKALLQLAKGCWEHGDPKRQELLDKMLRDGILTGYDHASQYTGVVEVLMHNLGEVLNNLGLLSVKHLTSCLALISSIMTDPFMATRANAIIAATTALRAVILNCWPRISGKASEDKMMNTIAVCWLNLEDTKASGELSEIDASHLTDGLIFISRMLQTLRQAHGTDVPPEMLQAIKKEPRLRKLFCMTATKVTV